MKIDRNQRSSLNPQGKPSVGKKGDNGAFLEMLSSRVSTISEKVDPSFTGQPGPRSHPESTTKDSAVESMVQELGKLIERQNSFSFEEKKDIERTLSRLDEALALLHQRESVKEARIIIRTELERIRQQI